MESRAATRDKQIEELQFSLDLERFITNLSTDLIGVPTDEIDEHLNRATEAVCRSWRVDHAFVLLFSRGGQLARLAHWWTDPVSADQHPALRERFRAVESAEYPNALRSRLAAGKALIVPSTEELSEEWEPERSTWLRDGLRGLIGVPIVLGEQMLGALGIVAVRDDSLLTADAVGPLKRIARLFANALERKRTSQALERQIEYARIATRISRAFALARTENLEGEVEIAVRGVARTLEADEAHVFVKRSDEQYAPVHLWFGHSDAAQWSTANRIDPSELHWWSERHGSGYPIVVRSPDDLPKEAKAERALAAALGFSAAIDVPLVHGGEVFGTVGIACRKRRNWAQEEIGLVTLVGELIAQALQQRRARDALRLSEERFQTAIDATNDGLWNWSTQSGEDAWWSARLYELLGYSNNQIPASRSAFEAHVHPADLPRLRGVYQANVSSGDPFQLELRLRPRQGDYLWVRMRGRIVSARADALRLAGSVQDISEQKYAAEQLLHAQRMDSVGVLAGGVAHDFNNLLTAIQNYARLALRHLERDASRCADALDGIVAAGDRAATLTHQLLAFSRRQVIHRRTLDLNTLIAEMVGMLRRLIPESIAIEFSPGHRLSSVDVDAGQIEQVLVNLCVNSRDAMADGGKLRIATDNFALEEEASRRYPDAKPGRYVQLRVIDTGLGMAPDVQQRAFEPFFTTKERGRGTGLGLSTVYGIVRQHGGFVDIESEQGVGTAVRVFIPSANASRQRDAESDPPPTLRGTELILVAEDNDLVRRVLVQLLEDAGYRVVVARDGHEAIQRFEERPDDFDLLFLDVIMPKMSGREVYEFIEQKRDIRVIFCSGYSGTVFDDEFFQHPNRRLIPKPYDGDNLLAVLREVLDS